MADITVLLTVCCLLAWARVVERLLDTLNK